jgi:TolB-like protein
VVVVPFVNISGDLDIDWLSMGIAQTVTADLERFQDLSVIGREGLARDLSDTTDDMSAREVARERGISWIVDGEFQRLGGQLRITARIVDVRTGATHATVKVDGRLDDVFALQDRIVVELTPGFVTITDAVEPVAAIPEVNVMPTDSQAPVTEGEGETGLAEGRLGNRRSPVAAPLAGDVTGGFDIGGAGSQSGGVGATGALTGKPFIRPFRTQAPPEIDGRLDDAVWQDAAVITDFVQRQPLDGALATENTEVYVAYDNDNIYLGVYAHYSEPGMMRANRTDRDQAAQRDDTVSVFFDPFLDQQRAYVFTVNAYGVQNDSLLDAGSGSGSSGRRRGSSGPSGGNASGPTIPRGDDSWDALYSSSGQILEDGFTAEMAIPFKSLRYPARAGDSPHTWGFQIGRWIRWKNEAVVWSPVSRDVPGWLPQMGLLEGMRGLSMSRNLEIQSTLTGAMFGTLDTDSGRVVDGDPKPDSGVNVKYGVTSNLTADFTYNPDFSQIESDQPQVEVNQRFALFFPELRPFFLEGAEIFNIPGPVRTVHTRTIVDPRYGGKLTGKVGKTTIGVLYANDEAPGNVLDADGPFYPENLGQVAQTFVGRARYDLYSESYIGAIVTQRDFLSRQSRLVGIDSNFRIGSSHAFALRAMGSDHRDEDALETTGYVVDASVQRTSRNLSYRASTYAISPDFQTDVGFVQRNDLLLGNASVDYRWRPQTWVIDWGPSLNYSRNHNFEGILEDEAIQARASFVLAWNLRFGTNMDRSLERYEGIDFEKLRFGVGGRINGSRLFTLSGNFGWGDEIYYDKVNPFLGYESSMGFTLDLNPMSRIHSKFNINRSRFTDPMGLFIPGVNTGEVDESGKVFTVNIIRALTTYQFSDRLLLRNISEFNTFDQKLGLNVLLTYRVNSGTAFYIGYDDHYQQREQFDDREIFSGSGYQQTNRAILTKIQYLFRF